mmetsp:Transcript_56069/g.162520  ORF Transcript_56069/g.162520 Transcript_56069/m.162520 type:complete len:211 (+) Transcript_56069:199-831(+)
MRVSGNHALVGLRDRGWCRCCPRGGRRLPNVHSGAEAHVKFAHFEVHGIVRAETGAGRVCDLDPHVRAPLQQLLVERFPIWVAVAKHVQPSTHTAAHALDHLLEAVVVGVRIVVATRTVLVRLGGHHDADVDVVVPTEDLHQHPERQVHAHDVFLPDLTRSIHQAAAAMVGQPAQATRELKGRREAREHRVPVEGDVALLVGADEDRVPV